MKPTGPQLTVFLSVVALISYVFVIAPKVAERQNADAVAEALGLGSGDDSQHGGGQSQEPQLFPAAGKRFIGVTTKEGAFDFKPVDAFEDTTGTKPSVMMFNEGWVNAKFDRSPFDKIAKRGMLPMLSWEPWNYKDDSVDDNGTHADQPDYKLSAITAGEHDAYLKAYAKGVKNLKYEVAIRLAHEMNGFWYPWGANVNGNKPGDYVKMWKHVRGIFQAEGVKNVTWVWSTNVVLDNKLDLADYYPGDDQVDWVGISGYYGTAGTENYRTPGAIFDATLKALKKVTDRPIVITETGATNQSGQRTKWIGDFFDYLPKHKEIIGFIWYEAVKELDWRLASTPKSAQAFGKEAGAAPFQVTWSGSMLPNNDPPTWGTGATPSSSPSPSTSSSKKSSKKPKSSKSASSSPSTD
ncbi:glycoside hydrolase family 26 protein [Winogradskya humida]|uniref:GH26 domain-containing protein n=1 Tax=Winogradskya humida TaxID=113566 RepID=A0ABQ3ZI51_9ACTN|nr:glycosyl hydrolase [Actinoplanes humidus]GIE18251.1 hypothetical protein Ahu01nite_013530 [Actinoplanes humidus]